MRKSWLFSLALGTLILIFSSLAPAQQRVAGPKMVIKERDFDFGEVREGAVITHSFKILNSGNETLTIVKVNPG